MSSNAPRRSVDGDRSKAVKGPWLSAWAGPSYILCPLSRRFRWMLDNDIEQEIHNPLHGVNACIVLAPP